MSPLREDDHRTLRKLCNEILPWVIGAQLLRRQWFVRAAIAWGYVGDLGAALAGLGFGPGIVNLIQGKLTPGQNALDALRASLPPQLFIPGMVGLAVYVLAKIVVSQENVVARALLAKEYARSISASYVELYKALAATEPLPGIRDAQRSIDERVQDAIKNQVWPFVDPPFPKGDFVEKHLKIMVDEIREKFMHNWDDNEPQGGRRP